MHVSIRRRVFSHEFELAAAVAALLSCYYYKPQWVL